MLIRSRSLRLLLALSVSSILVLGPAGCARSGKTRDKWWQFWRPKKAETSSIFYPDQVILPPPPDLVAPGDPGSQSPLDAEFGLPGQPPDPLNDELVNAVSFPLDPPIREAATGMISELQTVHFAYDSFALSEEAKQALDQNIEWILAHPGVDIQIEGHCDERGTLEYNLLLGERRAKAVMAYMIENGVPRERLHPISYGEERPLVPGDTEVAFSENRRAQFLVY